MNLHPLPRLTAIALLLTAIALLAPACSKAETRVTADAISGTWFLQCRTKERATTSCQSREERDITYQIWPGGELKRTTNGFDACTTSSWTLSGDELVLSCVGGGLTIDESWNVRLVDGRMVLYNDANRGRILVRDRAESPRPKGASSNPTNVCPLDAKLVEHSENDAYRGDGRDGTGKNMVGRLLMEVGGTH